MPLTKKTIVLFDPDQYNELKVVAKRERTSVGDIIRRAVRDVTLKGASVTERREAAQRLVTGEEEIGRWEDVEKLIGKGHTR